MAASCIFLASKTKEDRRKVEQIIPAVWKTRKIAPRKPDDPVKTLFFLFLQIFQRIRKAILDTEILLLRVLAFDLSISLPYPNCLKILEDLVPPNLENSIDIVTTLQKSAWSICNDMYY